MVAALFIAVMYLGQGFAFGVYQVRIATAIYALAYLFPFLTLPLALANATSNALFGSLGFLDIIGGFFAGIITVGAVTLMGKYQFPKPFVILPIILGPGLLVPLWLSILTPLTYWVLVLRICIGQTAPAIVGCILIQALSKRKVAGQCTVKSPVSPS